MYDPMPSPDIPIGARFSIRLPQRHADNDQHMHQRHQREKRKKVHRFILTRITRGNAKNSGIFIDKLLICTVN